MDIYCIVGSYSILELCSMNIGLRYLYMSMLIITYSTI